MLDTPDDEDVGGIEGVLEKNVPPYRRFNQLPAGPFVEAVLAHVRATGQPETAPGLYVGKLPKSAKYRIVWKIEVDQRKRPEGDRAPCPMCTPNRFLKGYLVWVYELQVASIIGHCCADHADEAEKRFKAEELQRYQEDYLLKAMPLLDAKADALVRLKPAAHELNRIYRSFRKKGTHIQRQLRNIKERGGARLRLTEILSKPEDEKDDDYVGPAGFRTGGVQSRDHEFGLIQGTTALIANYRPLVELDDVIRQVDSFVFRGDETAALEFICELTPEKRRAAVHIFRLIDEYYAKFIRRFNDCLSFFSRENIERLHAYGTSEFNHQGFDAGYKTIHGRPYITFRRQREEFHILISDAVELEGCGWEIVPYEK